MSTPPRQPDIPTQVRQVGKALDETYTDLLDMSDFGNRRPEDLVVARRSRALAAHAVRIMTDWSAQEAAVTVIDGGGDQGIDAIAIVHEPAHIYLVQSKWSETGTAKADETAVHKLFAGLTLIDSGESSQFNPRGQVLARRARELMDEGTVPVTQVIALMGTKPLAPGVKQVIANGEKEFNHHGDYVGHRVIHAPEIYAKAREDNKTEPVQLEVSLFPWFGVNSPYEFYEGIVQAEQIVDWAKHDNTLFDQNIRNPLGLTPINGEMVATLTDEPANFHYFNNGITILCDAVKVARRSTKYPESQPLTLTASGASVVNGAQTVRAVIDAAADEGSDAELAKVGVRVIVTGGDRRFAERTTKATNRQNHITERDYIALDPVQAALIEEFRAELGLTYSVRRSELEPQGPEGCSVVEAACALACAHDSSRFAARLVAAGSLDVLWEREGQGIYDRLFRPMPGVFEIWNAVKVLREVRTVLRAVREEYKGRGAALIDDGLFLIAHLVFRQLLAEDEGMGEPDPSLTWAESACGKVKEIVARTIPVLLVFQDADYGVRSDIKRICADPRQCADLANVVLGAIATGHVTVQGAVKYRRDDEKKPRKRRRPNAVHILVDQRALPDGEPLALNLYIPVEQEALSAWLGEDSRRSRATWSNNRAKPIIWAFDGVPYSPSGLIAQMWEQADWDNRPVSNQGTERWATREGDTLAALAWKLLDGLENEGGEGRE
ncbi:AIPR family protein [Streptomyces sp. NPDC056708]|uniref:AIPR family protein n=1 Tax=unclassified Streptomyces TaxID=2593676 RepID=UPI0036C357AB